MQTQIETYVPGFKAVGRPFRWRDRTGQDWLPEEMETRHLFFTVCMIWNHHMPIKTRPDYRRYSFGPYHTEAYLQMAIKMLLPELIRRKDRAKWMDKTLAMMAASFFLNSSDLLKLGGIDV